MDVQIFVDSDVIPRDVLLNTSLNKNNRSLTYKS